jgi:2C-methyl-D-erythritol 2,4-cyclodiphosphate synthase
MKVGVYIDGFNLYYGARGVCGKGTAGWRWLDLRSLAAGLIPPSWRAATVSRVVYCTARIDAKENPSGHADQDTYLHAVADSGNVDAIEYGYYVSRVKRAPLATEDRKGRPVLTRSDWPIMVRDLSDTDVPDASFIVSHARREEKASDVNVAAHLLLDALQGSVDAAIVISNDSDLRFPIREARKRLPVGTINPSGAYLAGALRGQPSDGVGGHWWRQLTAGDFFAHQLPDPAAGHSRPSGW